MLRSRLLFSWVGYADLRALSSGLSDSDRAVLLADVPAARVEGAGPLMSLLNAELFDEVHVLSNAGPQKDRILHGLFGSGITIHPVRLQSPIDHAELFKVVDHLLREVIGGRPAARYELCFHLSPGTPQMAAVWLLLGKTRYPATLFQTHADKVLRADVPFDITLDVVPELLRAPDAHLQHLAAQAPSEVPGFEAIVGGSRQLRLAVGRAKKAAIRDVPILLTGESGTGKEMFAQAIHHSSRRAGKPFRAINCAALPRDLLEAELFGVKKGAFTGAVADRPGLLEEAHGGTVFFDEIGECDAAVQAKLLRILQPQVGDSSGTRTFTRVGDTKERKADVRIIAATNRDLLKLIQTGTFREDLFYRLAVITVHLPPLRERRSDLAALAAALLEGINREFAAGEPGYEHKSLSGSATAFVRRCPWPGNVRQLRNALIQSAVMSVGPSIERADLEAAVAGLSGLEAPGSFGPPLGDGFDLDQHLQDIQRHYLHKAMEEAQGVKSKAARLLGMKNYQTLDAQLKRLKVVWTKAGTA